MFEPIVQRLSLLSSVLAQFSSKTYLNFKSHELFVILFKIKPNFYGMF
jgi:hypothetical protein